MNIEYKTRKLERICIFYYEACKAYGNKMAEKISMRINELKSVQSVEEMMFYSIGRCHPLKADRTGDYAMDLVQPYRLIFRKIDRKMIVL